MDEYFDAFIYLANWGTRWIMLRVPARLFDLETAAEFEGGDCFSCRRRGDHVALSFASEDTEDYDWPEGEGWLASILPARKGLLRGDQRALYLGWLLAVQYDEVDAAELEPQVPAGLGTLDPPLVQLARFLRIDDDLITAAAEHGPALPATGLSRKEIDAFLAAIPAKKKDSMLAALIAEHDPHLIAEIQQQARAAAGKVTTPPAKRRRSAGEIMERACFIEGERTAKETARRTREEAERARKASEERRRYLDSLKGKAHVVWKEVHELIALRQAKYYDHAVSRLIDLRDLAKLQGNEVEFRKELSALQAEHQRKPSLMERINRAQLLDEST